MSLCTHYKPSKVKQTLFLNPGDQEALEEVFKKLAKYEDAEEQGLLVRLPCKVGDTVWMLTKTLDINAGTMKDDIIPASITQLRGNKLNPIWYIAESKNDARDFHPSSIGKTVFLTRDAAEAALKGIQSINS